MKQKTLIIFSGLPGSGKSTLASRLASYLEASYLRIDTIEQGLKDVCGLSQIDGMGYRLSYRIAQENLLIGNTVIADSVNPWELTRKEWNNVAIEIGAQYLNIEIICSDKTEHQSRLKKRTQTIPGLKNPSWQEVIERDYHSWTMERIQLETAGKTIEEAFQELLTLIPSSYFH
jgi:predicted kinase